MFLTVRDRAGHRIFHGERIARNRICRAIAAITVVVSGCGRPWQLSRHSIEAAAEPPRTTASQTEPQDVTATAAQALRAAVEGGATSKTAAAAKPTVSGPASTLLPPGERGIFAPASLQKKSSKKPAAAAESPLSDDLVVVQSMSLQQALKYAVDNHPLLRSKQYEIEIAQAKLIDASLYPNPQFTLDADSPTQESGATEMTSRLMFTIPIGGRLGFGAAHADAGIRRAQLALSMETELILFEAADAAIEVMYLQEALALQRESIKLAQTMAVQIKALAATKGTVLDTHLADINVAQLELDEYNSEALLKLARLRLSRAIGLEAPRLVEVENVLTDEPLPRLSLERILAAVRETRPEIAESRVAVEEARRQTQLAHAEAIPDLEVGARYQDEFRDINDRLGARFQFDLPLFDRKQGAIAEGEAQLRTNLAMVKVTELTTISDVAAAFVELAPLQRRLEHHNRKIEPLRHNIENVLPEIFQAGQVTAPQVLDELQRLLKFQVQHLELRYRYNQLKVKLELFLGRPLATFAEPGGAPAKPPVVEPKRPKVESPKTNPFEDEPTPENVPALPKRASDETPREPRPFPPVIAGPELVTPAVHEAPSGIAFPTRLRATVETPIESASLPDADSPVTETPVDDTPVDEPAADSATMDP
jgi:cobalt-zinc-cadmium efflux system outer membrane protein